MSHSIDFSAPDLRSKIREITRRHGARTVRLFGSFARGEATESSDVDLLVDMESGRTLLDLIALQTDLEALLGFPVDIATTRSLSGYIRDAVEHEAVEL